MLKKLLCILIGFVLILGLASCSQNPQQNQQPTDTEKEKVEVLPEGDLKLSDYSIIERDGQYYLVFDDISAHQGNTQGQVSATVDFTSIADFIDAITKDKLTSVHKETIATFSKDEKENILLCDLNNMYEPKLPTNCMVDEFCWAGEKYSFSFSTDGNVFGYVRYLTKAEYDSYFQENYEKYFDIETIHITDTSVTEDNKTVTHYFTGATDSKQIRYTIVEANKTVYVDEWYIMKTYTNLLPESSSYPYSVDLYCEYDGIYFVIHIYSFTEAPTEEWLSQFSMTPYVHKALGESS